MHGNGAGHGELEVGDGIQVAVSSKKVIRDLIPKD
jgi:hypothetical protein